jgi:hypothetical protein
MSEGISSGIPEQAKRRHGLAVHMDDFVHEGASPKQQHTGPHKSQDLRQDRTAGCQIDQRQGVTQAST